MTKIERILAGLAPVRWIRNKSRRLILPGFGGICLYDVTMYFYNEIWRNQLGDRASAISWNFMLAIPPALIFLFTLLPFFHIKGVEVALNSLVGDISPNKNTYKIITGVIHDFLHTRRNGLLSFAFLLGCFYSSSGVQGILRTFDKISPGHVKRNTFQRRWTAIKITMLLLTLIMTCVLLVIVQGAMFQYLSKVLHVKSAAMLFFLKVARWIMIVLLFFFIISLIYRFGPSVKRKWRFLSSGSTLATFLMILTTLGFSYYVRHFSSYNRIYGSIGTIIVLMLWVYFNSLVLLIGFELNASISALQDARGK